MIGTWTVENPVAHWGAGISANTWKDAEVVFLFDEFWIPRCVVIATGVRQIRVLRHIWSLLDLGLIAQFGMSMGRNWLCMPRRLWATSNLSNLSEK